MKCRAAAKKAAATNGLGQDRRFSASSSNTNGHRVRVRVRVSHR